MINDLKDIWPHVDKKYRRKLTGLLLLMLVGALAELISLGAVVPFVAVLNDPEITSGNEFISYYLRIIGAPKESVVVVVSYTFAVLVILASVIRLILLRQTNRVVFGIGYSLSVRVFSSIMNRSYTWHITRNSSEALGALNKVQIVVHGYLHPLLSALVGLVIALAVIIMLVLIDPFVALIGAGSFAICYTLIAFAVRKRVMRSGVIIAKTNNQRIQEMQEGIGNIRDVILDSSQEIYIHRFSKIDAAMREAQASNAFLAASPRLAIEGIGLVIIAGFALIASETGGLSELLPTLAALGLGAQKLMPLVQSIYSGWNSVTAQRQCLRDVVTLIDERKKKFDLNAIKFENTISFADVTYRYPSSAEKSALINVNLKISKGSVIGIIGKTGSGKSTLVDLLMGLLPATSGKLMIDDIHLDTAEKLRAWSMLVAHVPQSIFLADCSVAQNIALGVELNKIDKVRLEAACRAAEIHDFIQNLKFGYETEVGERGIRFSGGQRQRIGIARALYRAAQVLVLDEATSALDDETEEKVIRNIHQCNPSLTIVMVAHRKSTLTKCDSVITMDDGRLVNVPNYTANKKLIN